MEIHERPCRLKRKIKVSLDSDWIYEFNSSSFMFSSDVNCNGSSSSNRMTISDPDYKSKRKRSRANSDSKPTASRSIQKRSLSSFDAVVTVGERGSEVDEEYPSMSSNFDESIEVVGGLEVRRERMLLREWLKCEVERGRIPGLRWIDKKEAILRIPWIHGSKSGWSSDNCKLFESWAHHTGRYNVGKPDPKRWKANFRCALNSLSDIVEVPGRSCTRGVEAFKAYRFLPEQPRKNSTRRLSIPQKLLCNEKHLPILQLSTSEEVHEIGCVSPPSTQVIPRQTPVVIENCSKYKLRNFKTVMNNTQVNSNSQTFNQVLDHSYGKFTSQNNLDKIPVMCFEFTDDEDDTQSVGCTTYQESTEAPISTNVDNDQENIEDNFSNDYTSSCNLSEEDAMSNDKQYIFSDQILTDYINTQADLKTLENVVFSKEIDQLVINESLFEPSTVHLVEMTSSCEDEGEFMLLQQPWLQHPTEHSTLTAMTVG